MERYQGAKTICLRPRAAMKSAQLVALSRQLSYSFFALANMSSCNEDSNPFAIVHVVLILQTSIQKKRHSTSVLSASPILTAVRAHIKKILHARVDRLRKSCLPDCMLISTHRSLAAPLFFGMINAESIHACHYYKALETLARMPSIGKNKDFSCGMLCRLESAVHPTWIVFNSSVTLLWKLDQGTKALARVSRRTSSTVCLAISLCPILTLTGTPWKTHS